MIEHVHFVRAVRPGKPIRWYVYAWRGGPRIHMSEGPTRPKLGQDELKAITAAIQNDKAPDPSTLLSLIRAWRSEDPQRPSSPEWADLAAGTRKTWGFALDLIEAKWSKTPLVVWNDARMVAKVVNWRNSRRDTPRAADIGVTVLRALLAFGRLRGEVTLNVADDIPRLYKGGDRAEIIWTDDDIARFEKSAVELNRPQMIDGLRLASVTGLRRADLVTLTWSQIGDFAIVKLGLKKSAGKRRRITLPRISALNDVLADLRSRPRNEGVETVLVNSFGDAWSGDGFGGSFNRVRDHARVVHIDDETGNERKKHLHDVRGTFCTRLLTETDLRDTDVATIMGWSPDRVAGIRQVYVDQEKLIVAIGERINRGLVKQPVKRSGG